MQLCNSANVVCVDVLLLLRIGIISSSISMIMMIIRSTSSVTKILVVAVVVLLLCMCLLLRCLLLPTAFETIRSVFQFRNVAVGRLSCHGEGEIFHAVLAVPFVVLVVVVGGGASACSRGFPSRRLGRRTTQREFHFRWHRKRGHRR